MKTTRLKLSPCGTPTVDLKGLPIKSSTGTLRLVFGSGLVAICMLSSLLTLADRIVSRIRSQVCVLKALLGPDRGSVHLLYVIHDCSRAKQTL